MENPTTTQSGAELARLQELFEAALLRPPGERDAFIAEACGSDEATRRRLEQMLTAYAQTGLLDRTPLEAGTLESVFVGGEEGEALPPQIGSYHIIRLIGSGGMGTVYEAQQEHPRRTVAVKVLAVGLSSRSALRRFEYESELLARLRHPGIAQVYEAGTHVEAGRKFPFFAMEHITGAQPITRFAQGNHLPVRQRLELFVKVCDAVHHGHQKGVIHRDLKPSNILVDGEGQPRVIDFGVARATDSDVAATMQTATGQLVGTLQYMSPEQCDADPASLDMRSDVYSLGVVLYELLCGKPPYDLSGQTVYEAMRRIKETLPATQVRSELGLGGDLATIVAKALEKERERRYGSAAELGDDLRRYLSGDTILARPATRAYQLRVFVRRNKALVAALAAIMLALLLGVIGTSVGMMRARSAQVLAQQKASDARAMLDYMQRMLSSARSDPALNGLDVRVSDLLDRMASEAGPALRGQPEAEIEARVMLAQAYNGIFAYQNYEKPAEQLSRAYELSRALPGGAESQRTLELAVELALPLAQVQGRTHEARELARWARDLCRTRLGEWHPTTVRATYALATAIGESEKEEDLRESVRMMRPIFEHVMQQSPADTPVEMYAVLADLPLNVVDIGDYAEAETLARRALARLDADGRSAELATFRSRLLNQIVSGLCGQGRVEEGAEMAGEALKHARSVMGYFHPETRMRLNNWSWAMRLAGRHQEAAAELQRDLELARKTLREDDNKLAWAMADLGDLWLERGQQEQGMALLEEAVTLQRKLFGPDDKLARVWLRPTLHVALGSRRQAADGGLAAQLYCALEDISRDPGNAIPLPSKASASQVKYRLSRHNAGSEEAVATGTLAEILASRREELPAGLYRLDLEIAGADGSGEPPPVKKNFWLLSSTWSVSMFGIERLPWAPERPGPALPVQGQTPVAKFTMPSLALLSDLKDRAGAPLEHFLLTANSIVDLPAGKYRFSVTFQDGARFYVDGRLLIDNWRVGDRRSRWCDVELEAGPHQLTVEFFHGPGLHILWLRAEPVTTR